MLHLGTSSVSGGSVCPAVRGPIAAQATIAALSRAVSEHINKHGSDITCAQRGRWIDKFYGLQPLLI